MDKGTSRIARNVAALAGACGLAIAAPLAAEERAGADRAAVSAAPERAGTSESERANRLLAQATFDKAQDYRLGRGVPQDFQRALQLYREAMELGHVEARANYGLLLFQQGRSEAAMPLIVEAAERGDPRAQYVLSLAHFNADHAPKDWVRAYALMTMANVGGMPQAREALAQMEEYVPASQREKAQALVRQWRGIGSGSLQNASLHNASAETGGDAAALQASAEANDDAGSPASDAWQVQLGTFGVASNAERLWSQISDDPVLSGTRPQIARSGQFTILRAQGFASGAEARSACATLQSQGHDCLVRRP